MRKLKTFLRRALLDWWLIPLNAIVIIILFRLAGDSWELTWRYVREMADYYWNGSGS